MPSTFLTIRCSKASNYKPYIFIKNIAAVAIIEIHFNAIKLNICERIRFLNEESLKIATRMCSNTKTHMHSEQNSSN